MLKALSTFLIIRDQRIDRHPRQATAMIPTIRARTPRMIRKVDSALSMKCPFGSVSD